MVVEHNTNEHYSYYLHFHLASGGFSGFKDDTVEQTGINSPQGTTQVYVYWYPKDEYSRPLLIDIQESSNSWYQRRYLDSNEWDPVKDPPTRIGTDPKILPLLQSIKKKPTGLSPGTIAGISVPGILTGGAAVGDVVWKGPALLRGLLLALRTLF
ncbi:hypothetical protein BEWA_049220 [Theileria equi strain WA]|uniref:Uncharacterized protein n=1 Tax=Theileria equi strain WA TaxID=1537102 RepID=L1LAZ8_THEEQ|nr:hypothetical protein BEWA_049220 [Theileria equi strain WA]EKX72455.1 hypothetical protein BEWA_049220 [Theileria equi strain WA]|eukprot:XP_004831907.1 hypothetical protein BEWA_049220 [Theileria equi strain WA]